MRKSREYVVIIEERESKRVTVQADGVENAMKIVEKLYRGGNIDMDEGARAFSVYLAVDEPYDEMTDFQEICSIDM